MAAGDRAEWCSSEAGALRHSIAPVICPRVRLHGCGHVMLQISQTGPFAVLDAHGEAMTPVDIAADGRRELQGPSHQLEHLHLTVLLSACSIHGGDPALPGVVDTGIRHQQVLGLLNSHDLVIDQHLVIYTLGE